MPNPFMPVSITEEVKLYVHNAFFSLYNIQASEFMLSLQYCLIISLNEALINHLCFPVKWSHTLFSHY